MAFSGRNSQGWITGTKAPPRISALAAGHRPSRERLFAAEMLAPTPGIPRIVVCPISGTHRAVTTLPSVAHGHTARRAQLRPLRHHAARDLGDVGNKIGTEPHGVRRTCFAGLRRPLLGGGATDSYCRESDEEQSGRQKKPAGEVHGTQHLVLSLLGSVQARAAHGRNLEHDRKTENQFSEKFQPRLKFNSALEKRLRRSQR